MVTMDDNLDWFTTTRKLIEKKAIGQGLFFHIRDRIFFVRKPNNIQVLNVS